MKIGTLQRNREIGSLVRDERLPRAPAPLATHRCRSGQPPILLDVETLGCELFLVLSPTNSNAPKGTGALFVRRGLFA